METVFEATLQVALYPYNDLLIRTKPPAGHGFAVDAINGEPSCPCSTPAPGYPPHQATPLAMPRTLTLPHTLTMLHPLTTLR